VEICCAEDWHPFVRIARLGPEELSLFCAIFDGGDNGLVTIIAEILLQKGDLVLQPPFNCCLKKKGVFIDWLCSDHLDPVFIERDQRESAGGGRS
jgi:hypothetical protein